MPGPDRPFDPDFSRELLEDLYTYRRKRKGVAWLLWATLGWMGVHRFYLEREFTGALMLLTGGGGLIWWLVDARLLGAMVRNHNQEQARREREGLPPLELDSMPPLTDEILEKKSEWVERWEKRGMVRKALRLSGDLLVLLGAGTTLGSLTEVNGALEAISAVVLLAGVTAMGAGPHWLEDVPGVRTLLRWSHRLRLFYYYNEPGSPLALILRPVAGMLWAPFSKRARTEVKLYVELGAAFTAIFVLLDIVPGLLWPMVAAGESPALFAFGGQLVAEALGTFFLTYAFSAPIGAVLTAYLLVRRTHRVPRLLAGLTLMALGMGVVAG